MKYLLSLFILVSSFAWASDYKNGRLSADATAHTPRRPTADPVPFTEPRENDRGYDQERRPYRDLDDAPDYHRDEDERLALQEYDLNGDVPRKYEGLICNHILSRHARYR